MVPKRRILRGVRGCLLHPNHGALRAIGPAVTVGLGRGMLRHRLAGSVAFRLPCVGFRCYANRKGYASGHHLISPCCEVSISFPSPLPSNTLSI